MNATDRLRPFEFQETGIQWLATRPQGAILADDMGLGKTMQTIVAATRASLKRCLVITPNSTRRIWKQELDKWAPYSKYAIIDAQTMTDEDRRDAILDKTNQFVVINYQLMLRYVATLTRVYWDVTIWDEAHTLRNRQSKTHKAHRLLVRKSNAKRMWYLTGTPVNNAQEDYWPMLRSFVPGFGSYWNFAHKYCEIVVVYPPKYQALVDQLKRDHKPIPSHVQRSAYGTTVANVNDPDDPRVKALVEAIRPHVLRRVKEQVYPQMPHKTVQTVPVTLDPTYDRLYNQLLTKMKVDLPTMPQTELLVNTELAQTTRLLQLCTDWHLLLGESARLLPLSGPKSQAILETIDELHDEPFVVFSQWSRVIDMTQNLFHQLDIKTSKYTGENTETRDKELDAWLNGETQALLVTLGAGGVGLDFTRASTALFVDRSWNPKVNEQAEDRLHRHGQMKPVLIRCFVTENTIETNNQSLSLQTKTQISENLVESLV